MRWFLTYTFSSCLPNPSGLAMPVRPGVVGAAVHPHLRSPGSGCPQLHLPAATGGGGALLIAARLNGASWRTMSVTHSWSRWNWPSKRQLGLELSDPPPSCEHCGIVERG